MTMAPACLAPDSNTAADPWSEKYDLFIFLPGCGKKGVDLCSFALQLLAEPSNARDRAGDDGVLQEGEFFMVESVLYPFEESGAIH